MTEKNSSDVHSIGEFYIDKMKQGDIVHIVSDIRYQQLPTGEKDYDYLSPCGTTGFSYDKLDPDNGGSIVAKVSEFIARNGTEALAQVPVRRRCPVCFNGAGQIIDNSGVYHPENDPLAGEHYNPWEQ